MRDTSSHIHSAELFARSNDGPHAPVVTIPDYDTLGIGSVPVSEGESFDFHQGIRIGAFWFKLAVSFLYYVCSVNIYYLNMKYLFTL